MRPAHEDPEYAPLAAVDRSAVLSPAGTSSTAEAMPRDGAARTPRRARRASLGTRRG